MTVNSDISKVQYQCDGVSRSFAFPYAFFSTADLTVTLYAASTSTTVGCILGGGGPYDYIVTGALDPQSGQYLAGGQVIFNNAPPAIYGATLQRVVSKTQNTAFVDNSKFPAKANEGGLDRLTMIVQELNEILSRAMLAPSTDANAAMLLAGAADRANRILGFDAAGNPMLLPSSPLTAPQSALYMTFLQTGTGARGRSVQDKLTERVSPLDYTTASGQVPGTGFDDTLAVQTALNYLKLIGGGMLWTDRDYSVSPNATLPGLAGVFSAGSVCLDISGCNNVRIDGPGRFLLRAGSTGSSGAVFGNVNGQTLTGFEIGSEVTIDGNSSHTTGTISGVVVVNGVDCTLAAKVRNITYCGLQYSTISLRCKIVGAVLTNIGYIAIQAQYPVGLQIGMFEIDGVGNNAIDIFGNSGAQRRNIISVGVINGGTAGVFFESAGDTIATNIEIDGLVAGGAGFYLNQINTAAANIVMTANRVCNSGGLANVSGIFLQNSSGFCVISDFEFEDLKWSIYSYGGSGIHIGKNYHRRITLALIGVLQANQGLVWSNIEEQIILEPRGPYPFTTSPNTNGLNWAGRYGARLVACSYCLSTGQQAATVEDEYTRERISLTPNAAWGGAYAVYTGGQTLFSSNANPPALAGNYIVINGGFYYIAGTPSGFVYHIQDGSRNEGDFTATVNGPYVNCPEYWPEWQTT
jgi:hypothetical protein